MAAIAQYSAAGVRPKTQTRRVSPISRETGLLVVFCALVIISYAFLQLLVASEVAGTLKSIVSLEAKQTRLTVEYDQLLVEAEGLQAPGTIELTATLLGLKPLVVDSTR
jgi:hypothetical protein